MKRLLAAILILTISAVSSGAETVIAFTASWCGPCRQFKADYATDRSMLGDMVVRVIDVDENRAEARRFRVRSMPTFVVLDDGREVRRVSGYSGAADLKSRLDGK